MKKSIDKFVEWLLVLMMALMVLNVTWQVLSRFLAEITTFIKPSSLTEETARFLMIWLGFIGGSYVAGQKMHPAIDLLSAKLSVANQRKLNIGIQFLVMVFALLALVIGGYYLVSLTFTLKQTSAALHLPFGVVYSCIPISGILLIYYSFNNMLKS